MLISNYSLLVLYFFHTGYTHGREKEINNDLGRDFPFWPHLRIRSVDGPYTARILTSLVSLKS